MSGMLHLLKSHTTRLWTGIALIGLAVLLGVLVHGGFLRSGDAAMLDEFVENREPIFTTGLTFVTNLFSPLGTIVISLIVAVVAGLWSQRWRFALFVALSVGLSAALTAGLKILFQRDRPPELTRLVTETNFSFPSGHSTGIASLALATAWILTLLLRQRTSRNVIWLVAAVWTVAAALIPLVAGSRLYLGVHWFTDITAGIMIGLSTTLILTLMLPAPKHTVPDGVDAPPTLDKPDADSATGTATATAAGTSTDTIRDPR